MRAEKPVQSPRPLEQASIPSSIEAHAPTPYELIDRLQLEYCARLYEKKIPQPSFSTEDVSTLSFTELLDEYSSIRNQINLAFKERTGAYAFENKEVFEHFKELALSRISDTYARNPDSWIDKIPAVLTEAVLILPAGKKEELNDTEDGHEDVNGEGEGPRYAGLINYGVHKGVTDVPEADISAGDTLIQIHMSILAGQREESPEEVQNLFSKDSLKALAKSIQENAPNAKAVIAQSWLMSTPIAKRIGFTVLPAVTQLHTNLSFWGQFLDQHGQLDQKRVRQFLETGEPPFAERMGYMKTEDFLKKYS